MVIVLGSFGSLGGMLFVELAGAVFAVEFVAFTSPEGGCDQDEEKGDALHRRDS
jgi:hypothetical protein